MSVINQALRDLEKRGGTEPVSSQPIGTAAYDGVSAYSEPSSNKALGVVVAVSSLLAAALAAWWVFISIDFQSGSTSNALSSTAPVLQTQAHSEPQVNDSDFATEHTTLNSPAVAGGSNASAKSTVPVPVASEVENAIDGGTSAKQLVAESTNTVESVIATIPEQVQKKSIADPVDPVLVSTNADYEQVISKSTAAPTASTSGITLASTGPGAGAVANADRAPVEPQSEAILQESLASRDMQAALSARRLAEEGRLREARADLEQFIQEADVHDASRVELAKVLELQADHFALSELLDDFERFNVAEIRMIAARHHLHFERPNEAYQVLTSALPNVESMPHYYALLAAVESRRGRHLEQINIYQRLIDAHGDKAKWWLGSAIAWDRLENYESAKQAYTKAQQLSLSDASLVAFVDQRLKQLRGYP